MSECPNPGLLLFFRLTVTAGPGRLLPRACSPHSATSRTGARCSRHVSASAQSQQTVTHTINLFCVTTVVATIYAGRHSPARMSPVTRYPYSLAAYTVCCPTWTVLRLSGKDNRCGGYIARLHLGRPRPAARCHSVSCLKRIFANLTQLLFYLAGPARQEPANESPLHASVSSAYSLHSSAGGFRAFVTLLSWWAIITSPFFTPCYCLKFMCYQPVNKPCCDPAAVPAIRWQLFPIYSLLCDPPSAPPPAHRAFGLAWCAGWTRWPGWAG